jgi:2-polyprenyl-6-hydroxyphenyl methylase/3-demethylubiquinone-9 3-methyltransferase
MLTHTKWNVFVYILNAYKDSDWAVKIFVLIRYLVCPWEKIVERLIPLVDDGKLLDIGCGHGLLLHLVHMKTACHKCVGLDHDRTKIAAARRSTSNNSKIAVLESCELPRLSSQRFNCITLIDVLYTVPPKDWSKIWKLVHENLEPDGVLLIKETVNHPSFKYWVCLLQEIFATKILKYTKGQFPFLPSFAYYLEDLTQNGFDVIEHMRVDQGFLWPHYLFIARRKPFFLASDADGLKKDSS